MLELKFLASLFAVEADAVMQVDWLYWCLSFDLSFWVANNINKPIKNIFGGSPINA